MTLKKYIKVRDLDNNRVWRDFLCVKGDDGYSVMPSHAHLAHGEGQIYTESQGAENTVICGFGESVEVIWQADELPV